MHRLHQADLLQLIPCAKRRSRCRQKDSILALHVPPLLYRRYTAHVAASRRCVYFVDPHFTQNRTGFVTSTRLCILICTVMNTSLHKTCELTRTYTWYTMVAFPTLYHASCQRFYLYLYLYFIEKRQRIRRSLTCRNAVKVYCHFPESHFPGKTFPKKTFSRRKLIMTRPVLALIVVEWPSRHDD